MPAAAPMFSTITCWCRICESGGVNTRAMTSNAPPAANGTTKVSGRVGQSCACVGAAAAMSATTAAQMRRDRHDLVARHHQRLAGAGAVFAAFIQHFGEARPRLRALVLAAELALAVAPAAVGDDRGDALVDTTGVDCDRPAEARADEADALRIDRGMLRQERQRAARILDLFKTDDAAEFALAVAAAAHVEA